MKKIFLPIILFCLLTIIFTPVLVKAQSSNSLVPKCGPTCTTDSGGNTTCSGNPCSICDFFQMLVNIYSFIVLQIATPLAVVAVIIGGILILISAGNPNLAGLGKKILYAAIIGLALVFCSYVIIQFVMTAVGYTQNGGNWWTLSISC